VLIEGRREDHLRRILNLFQHLEAAHSGHLHVQKNQVGMQFLDEFDSLLSIASLAKNLDAGVRPEQTPQLGAGDTFVVYDQGFHGCGVMGILSAG